MIKRISNKLLIVACSILCLNIGVGLADDFPLRGKYPDVRYILTEELAAQYDDTIIIDVRSKMEFDVAHVNKAKHLPIATATFVKNLEKIREKNGSVNIAFYCNGHTCAKSYKAVIQADNAGFKNVVAYDAGIFDWIISNPDKATLMGETPAPIEKIIPKSVLKKRMLDFPDFKSKAEGQNSLTIDIREAFQRKIIPDVPNMRNIPLDRLIKLINQKQFQDKNLLILDAVGKQVRWLQYHLEKNGYRHYHFLNKGVAGI